MVERFKGQVKISDVQREFNDIINTINTIVDTYNKSKYVNEIDYTVGDKSLGNAGYTLTVGGLKQVMKAMNGTVIGAKVFEITPNKKYKISDGVLITESKIYRLPDRVVDVPSNITKVESIYYNTNTDKYEIVYKKVGGVDNPNSFKITDIAPSRKSIYKNDIKNVQVEDISGKYKINSQDTTFSKGTWGYGNGYPYGEENTDTSSEAKFVSGMEANQSSNNSNNYYELVFGDGNYLVSSNAQNGKHKNAYLQLINFLYVPKGVKQPYKVKKGDRAIIKGINVIENLNLGENY